MLTFTGYEPGRVVYYTSDGDCYRYPWSPSDCGRPQARASEDYGAVKGEWIFTEAGTRTIRIPILDDDLDEADYEAFAVHASMYDDVAEQTTWEAVTVRITDDDPRDDSADPPATTAPTATTASGRSSSSSDANAIPASDDGDAVVGRGATASDTPTPVAGGGVFNAEVQPGSGSELASDELQPGPGFELVSDGDPEAPPERDDRSGGSASWLPLGLGAAALSAGAIVLARRRLRWSPTRV